MIKALLRLFVASFLLLGATFADAQPTFTISNVKNSCAGLDNGSFSVNILTATGTVNVLVFGPPNPTSLNHVAGDVVTFTGLRPQNYAVIVQDANGSSSSSQIITNVAPNISFASAAVVVNNSSCSTPNGTITINPTGGNGGPYSYSWTGPGAFLAATQNLSGLASGNYTVTITEGSTNCSFTSPLIPVTDPSPSIQTVSTTSPEAICQGDPATISLTSSQVLALPLSYYEILNNNVPTGVRVNGTGGAVTLTLPSGSFVNGDVLTVRAVDDLCAPALMSGSVTLNLNNPPASAVLSGTGAICAGQNTNLSVAIAGGTPPYSFTITNFGPVVGYTTGAPISVSPVSTTTYTLSGLVIDSKGCSVTGSGTATVSVNPLPTATINASAATICAGQGSSTLTFTITGASATYNVSYSDGTTTFNLPGIATGATVSVSPAVTTTYTITSIVDASTLCAGVAGSNTIVNVSIPPNSATLSLAGANPICAGQSTSIKVNIVGGVGPFNFTIPSLPPQVGYVSGSAISVTPPVGTTNLDLTGVTVTDSKGCTVVGTGSVAVVVNPLPTAIVTSSPGAICAGQGSSTLTFTMTGTPPFDVQFFDGAATQSFSTASLTHTVSVSPGSTTNYSIASIADATTCAGLPGSNTTVTVNTPPSSATINVIGPDPICFGQTTNISVTIVGGTGPYDFAIPGLPAQVGYVSGGAISVSPATTTPYIINGVTVTDSKGCTVVGTGGVLIVVNPLPTAVISASPTSICNGSSTTLTFTMTGTPPFNVQYTTGAGIASFSTPSLVQTVSVSPTTTTNFAITSITDANPCVGIAGSNVTINVNTPPSNATLSGTNTICSGTSTDLSVVITGGTSPYTVTINNGVPVQNNYTSGSAIAISPALTTTYNLVSVLDANGCPAQVLGGSAIVTVNPGPTSGVLSGTATTCGGITNLSVNITGGTPPYSFTVNNGVGLQTGYISGSVIPVSPVATTTYSIPGNITDANGCFVAGSGSATITVNTPASDATLNGTTTICTGNSTNLSVTITGGTAPYTVTINNGVPVQVGYTSGSSISVSPASTTNYSLVSVTDANGCPAQALSGGATVTINPGPSSAILGGTATTCGTSTNLSVAITGGTSPYSFTIDNGVGLQTGYISGTAISVTPAVTTTYSILGNVTDATGCFVAGIGTATITVNPLPAASLSGNSSICVGQSASITVSFTAGNSPWDFSYTDGSTTTAITGISTNPFTFSPVPNPILTTTYSLVSVSNACGAGTVSGSATVTVNAIIGNQATYGIDTWLGYVYDDAGDVSPLPGRINFSNTKYRGVIDETDIANMSSLSSYNTITDAFDVNIANNPSGNTIHSTNVCGTYNDSFSIRFRMRKTFAAGIYTFTVGSDDGVRLQLDGVDIIPGAFVNQAYTTYTSVSQCITAGTHDLVIEYYENTGFSRLTFDYQVAPAPTVPTPVVTCVNSPAPTLTASSVDPAVIGFNWYKDAGLTLLLFSGTNFTPAAADLNMTVAGTTSFFATAMYTCGESVAAQVDVNVVTTATITPPAAPTQVCQTAGIIDLNTLVSASPPGGTFTFSGTGVTTSPNFDPTLVAGTSTITANYSTGTCNASINFNIDVVTVASVTVPASTVTTCQSAGLIDLLTLVSATPTGGTFAFTGAGVTGTNFDPSSQSGPVPITVNYNVGGCLDSKNFSIDVSATATITATNTMVCPGAGMVDLTTLVSAVPGGGVFTFTGSSVTGNNFDPSTHAGSTVTIAVDYALGGCTATGSVDVTVRTVADPLCGTSTNCSVFSLTITDIRPSCVNQNDGVININVTGGSPNYVVTLSDGGSFNQAIPGPGPLFTFTNLSPAGYFYTVQDGGGNVCTLPHTLPLQSSIQASASNFVDAQCFNQPVGGATLTVVSGGTTPYEYSIDGGTTWIGFTSPVVINNLMPSATPYAILVRDDASDLCVAQAPVTISNAVADIAVPNTVTNATCANNDGSVVIGTVSGGTAPYTFIMDGVNFPTLPPGNVFTGLSGGIHTFSVVDAVSCQKDFPIAVSFPGLVNLTTTIVDPDCTGNGTNGQLLVTITSVGSFQVGISTDPLVAPTSFQNILSAGGSTATFLNLGKGAYFITAQSVGAQCPTVVPATLAAGPIAIKFTATASNIVCFENSGGVNVTGISGAPAIDFGYEVSNSAGVVQSGAITSVQAASGVLLTGIAKGDYQIQLTQDQSASTGCVSPIASSFIPFTVDGPTAKLDTASVVRQISYPDQATGSMLITLVESGEEPYEVRLELVQPLFPSQSYLLDWTAINRNTQSFKMEFNAGGLFTGEYKLSIRDALGCEKDYTIDIELYNGVDIPNVFTPNGDGVNDVFYIRNLPSATNVIITNRWGKEVYRAGDYKNDWTGGNSDDGIYYYHIQAAGQTYNGWLEIQRGLGQP